MKHALVLAVSVAMLSGCLIRTRTSGRSSAVRSCPPSEHWEHNRCVHNGRGHDKHDKHDKRDHRDGDRDHR
jgi:hypothetical protein